MLALLPATREQAHDRKEHQTPHRWRQAHQEGRSSASAKVGRQEQDEARCIDRGLARAERRNSVRGAMSGAIKKQRGLSIVSTKTGKERIYRIEAGK